MCAVHPSAISFSLRSYSSEMELHQHDFTQIVLPQSGSLEIEVAGKAGRVNASQGVVIPCKTPHAFLAKGNNSFLVLDLPNHGMDGEKTEALVDCLGRGCFFAIRPDIRHLLNYASSNRPWLHNSKAMAESWSHLLLASLRQAQAAPQRLQQLTLSKALNYIEQNLSANMGVAEIARHAGISERRLYRLFNQHLGTTPRAHIASLRLHLAIDLLRQSSLSITDIAHRVGYSDQSALTHALKKAHKLTPAALRKQTGVL